MKVVVSLLFLAAFAQGGVIQNKNADIKYEIASLRDAILRANVIKNTTLEMIEMEGYPAENHYVTTPDGYILNVHRIPSGKNGEKNNKVVYLQHGILASSSDWIIQGPGKSLAYVLADEGYDVWMGNARGNIYSRNHTTYNPDKDSAFWQFSWHQIGTFDLPAIIDYVLEQTGVDGVYYSGHSQGSTAFYVMGSSRPEYNSKIKAYAHLAPIAFMNHMTSPLLKFLSLFEGSFEILADLIGVNEFLPGTGALHNFTEKICEDGVGPIVCENVLFVLCGFSPNEMNLTLVPTIMAHTPAGASVKQIMHYAQLIDSGFFRQYDFGAAENFKLYGSLTPPDYDLTKVVAPGYLLYGKNDWLAAERDVERLYEKLGNVLGKFMPSDNDFNHLDFTYGINAHSLVYTKVIGLFSQH